MPRPMSDFPAEADQKTEILRHVEGIKYFIERAEAHKNLEKDFY